MSQKKLDKISKKQFREIVEYAVHYHFCYCYLCGEPILPGQHYNLDHVIPRSKGGPTEPHNLRPTHCNCNQAKADMLLHDFRRIQQYVLEEKNRGK